MKQNYENGINCVEPSDKGEQMNKKGKNMEKSSREIVKKKICKRLVVFIQIDCKFVSSSHVFSLFHSNLNGLTNKSGLSCTLLTVVPYTDTSTKYSIQYAVS